jgi:SpoVK/Ycf46/Vps4 family AAA+-type ATPase
MIQIAEALAPCILWIDEIDKAFMEQNSNGDNGTTSRVLATFITWLSEKTSQVFVVATANNFYALPLEIIRKGRFDEIFFVNLPSKIERKQIFEVFLIQLRPNNISNFDVDLLSNQTDGFSGAEIQQSIIEGMHFAFNEKREFTTSDILFGVEQIIPLSQIDPERTKKLQNWALSGRVRLAS